MTSEVRQKRRRLVLSRNQRPGGSEEKKKQAMGTGDTRKNEGKRGYSLKRGCRLPNQKSISFRSKDHLNTDRVGNRVTYDRSSRETTLPPRDNLRNRGNKGWGPRGNIREA